MGKARLPLEDCFNDMALVRTTFETLARFQDDGEVRADLLEVIEAARRDLAGRLAGVVIAVEVVTDADFEEFRDMAVQLAEHGMPGKATNEMKRREVYDDNVYRLPLPDGMDADAARAMSPREFARRLVADLRERAATAEIYADAIMFTSAVYRPFIALMFVYYATTDPIWYRRP